jgi:hypothetical protein
MDVSKLEENPSKLTYINKHEKHNNIKANTVRRKFRRKKHFLIEEEEEVEINDFILNSFLGN